MRVSGAMTMRFGSSRSPMRIGAKSGWLWTDRGIGAGPSRLLSGEGEERLRPPRAVATDFRYLLCIRYMDRPCPAAARERRRYARNDVRELRRGSGCQGVGGASKIGNEMIDGRTGGGAGRCTHG